MSRLETVKKKYPAIDWDIAKTLDPSKNSKYLEWIGVILTKGSSNEEVKELLLKFEKNKDKLAEKDIAKYDAVSLKKALEEAGQSKKEAKIAGSTEVATVNGIKIVFIEGQEAVKAYCAGTKWCISNYNTFVSYCREKNFFVVANNNTKVCILYNFMQRKCNEMYTPSDVRFNPDDKSTQELLKFASANTNLSALTEEMSKFSQTTKNIWYNLNRELNTENLNKAISISSNNIVFDHFVANSSSTAQLKQFLRFLAKEKKTYPEMAKLAATSKYSYYDDTINYGGYTYVYLYWDKICFSPEERQKIAEEKKKKAEAEKAARKKKMEEQNKKDQKKILLAIKNKGGLAKALQSKVFMKSVKSSLKSLR